MATITPTQTNPPTGAASATPNVIQTIWTGFTENDTCTAVRIPDFPDQTVAVTGTFGSATVIMQGSNDNTNFFTLTDPLGNDVSGTAAYMRTILQAPLWLRPSQSGGTAASLTITLESRR